MNYIGARVRAIDWAERTSGKTVYSGDIAFPELLIGRILRSPYPYARIASIDTSKARKLPGVRAVITCADFPAGARYLHEGAQDRSPLADGVVRYVGEEVAAVAADTLQQAEAALRAIKVDYVVHHGASLSISTAPDATVTLHDRPSGQKNVAFQVKRAWGAPLANAEESSETVVRQRYRYPRVNHACMEPNIAVARWSEEDQKLELWTSTQAPYYIVLEVARVLGLKPEQVVCREVAVGGGFGAKSKIAEHEAIAAMLAKVAGGTVKLELTRTEEFAFTKTRHEFSMDLSLAVDGSGHIQGIKGDFNVNNGAYSYSGVSVTAASLKAFGMMYRPSYIDVNGKLLDTATLPGGQFRGYGSTQTGFALECLVDEAAENLQIDPIELRLKNANQSDEVTLIGARLGQVSLTECLETVRDQIHWQQEKANRVYGRGVGVAAAVHPSGAYAFEGSNRSDCAIDIFTDGTVRLRFGGADAGTGQRTILAQIAATELGVELGAVQVLSMDSEQTPYDQGAWSSRGTHYSGQAARLVCQTMAQRLKHLAETRWNVNEVWLANGHVCADGKRIPLGEFIREADDLTDNVFSIECSYIEPEVVRPDPKTGMGNYSASYSFAAHAAVVNVDPKLGTIEVEDYVAAHDVGVAINPTFVEGQIAGGAVMGLGAALGEEIIMEQGKVVNASYMHYALPRAADVPRIRPFIVGEKADKGPYGAKGTGELGVNPPASVIANAVYDAIGVRIREVPITPDKILDALDQKNGVQRKFAIWRRPNRWWIELVRRAYPLGLLKVLHARQQFLVNEPTAPIVADVTLPETLDAALPQLSEESIPLGGGTDIQPSRRQGLIKPVRLVSLQNIKELRGIEIADDGGLCIDAAATLAEIALTVASVQAVLTDAIATIASPQIREMATLAGNLLQDKRCWFYRNAFPCYKRKGGLAPCYAIEGDHRFYHAVIDGHRCQAVTPSDLAVVLNVLDAAVTLKGSSHARSVKISDFYTGPGETVCAPTELLTEVRIPPLRGKKTLFKKLRLWEGDFAMVSAAISVSIDTRGQWHDLRICLGGVAPTPWRAHKTERSLEGRVVTDALLRDELERELNSVAHPLARNAWKLTAAVGLVERLAEQLPD